MIQMSHTYGEYFRNRFEFCAFLMRKSAEEALQAVGESARGSGASACNAESLGWRVVPREPQPWSFQEQRVPRPFAQSQGVAYQLHGSRVFLPRFIVNQTVLLISLLPPSILVALSPSKTRTG